MSDENLMEREDYTHVLFKSIVVHACIHIHIDICICMCAVKDIPEFAINRPNVFFNALSDIKADWILNLQFGPVLK